MRPSTDILVFTDSQDIKKVFNSFLSIDQSTIQFCSKDESGLKKFCSMDFDLVVVEISQPLISEIQFIEHLRSLNKLIPIIIVSEYFRDTKSIVFQNQISDFISMPLTLEKLSSTLENVRANKKLDGSAKITASPSLESKELSFLYEVSKSLSSITDFEVLLNTILETAKDALNAERATLFVLDKDTNELWSRVGTGIERREIRFSKDSGIAGEVVSTEREIHSENPYEHPSFNKAIDSKTGFVTRNLICVPLKNLKNEILGAFQVLNKLNGGFTTEDMVFFKAIASTVAVALENTLLHEDIKRKYDEIHRLCDELYIAQNQIVLDSKHVVLSETLDYIKNIKTRFPLKNEIDNLKNLLKRNEPAVEQTDRISQLHLNFIDKIENYITNTMSDLSMRDHHSNKIDN